MRREGSFCRFAEQKHREAASALQSFTRFLNSKGTARQALQLFRVRWQPVVSYLFACSLSPFLLLKFFHIYSTSAIISLLIFQVIVLQNVLFSLCLGS